MRRGITPVVAIALLLGMTVAASGGAYAWVSQVQEGVQEDASSALATQVEVRDLRCEDAQVEVALKNSGGTDLTGTTLNAYLYRGGTLVTTASEDISSADVRQAGGLSILSLPFVLTPGTRYRVEVRVPADDVVVESTCQARTESLVGYWDFETKQPGTVTDAARDHDGTYENNELDGTLYNFDFDSDDGWTGGRKGGALEFSGEGTHPDTPDTHVQLDEDISNRFSGNITVSWWGKIVGSGLYVASGSISDGFSFYTASPRFLITNESGDWEYAQDSTDIRDNEWHHVAGVYDRTLPGENIKIYVDGGLAGTADFDGDLYDWSKIAVGGAVGGNYRTVDGIIDDVKIYNQPFSASEISSLHQGEDLRTGITMEWMFDEGSGTTAHDTSKWVSGKVDDYALDFDGADDHVVVPHDDSLNFGSDGSFTVMLWSKLGAYDPGNLPSFRHYVTKSNGVVYHSNDGPGWGIYWATTAGDQICFGTRDSATSGSSVCNGATPNDGEWHFIAAQKDGSQLALFVDGSWFTSGSARYDDPTTEDLEIHGDGRYVKAVSDEIRIYDTALTKGQISSFYNATK